MTLPRAIQPSHVAGGYQEGTISPEAHSPPRAGARIELALLVLHPVLFPLAILNILSFCVLGPGFGMFECVYVCAYVYVFPYLSYFFSPLLLIQ